MKTIKLFPLIQAVREFITEMDFPPAPKEGPSSNTVYSAIIQALLGHARHLRASDTEVTVTPSSQQLASVLHCSTRTVRRLIEAVQEHGMVTRIVRNGHISNSYVIHKHSNKLKREDKDVHPEANNSRSQGGQLPLLGWTRMSYSGVNPLRK